MGNYEDYINRLKGAKAELDGGKMYSRIEIKIAGRARRNRLLMGGALGLLLIGSVIYFNVRPYLSGGSETLADYVFQQNEMNGDQILNYVFMD